MFIKGALRKRSLANFMIHVNSGDDPENDFERSELFCSFFRVPR